MLALESVFFSTGMSCIHFYKLSETCNRGRKV